jgi:hypothetical protein
MRREREWGAAAPARPRAGRGRPARSRGAAAPLADALRELLVTGRLLARRLHVSDRARLLEAGVLREMAGRPAWHAFAVAK